MSLPLFILTVYGISYLLGDSYIFSKPRMWISSLSYTFERWFNCYFCMGIWISLILVLSKNYPIDPTFQNLLEVISWTFAGAGGSFIINIVERTIGVINYTVTTYFIEEE